MTPALNGEQSATSFGVRALLARVDSALTERQALLDAPHSDAPLVQRRIDALGLRVDELLEQIVRFHPPAEAVGQRPRCI